jgi:RNA polymerase sigma-70 factor (ECF subfamily)
MIPDQVRPITEAPPDETRLAIQARSGDAEAFIQLYDAYVDRVFRHVYFQVINNSAAEGITARVFRNAWEQRRRSPKVGSAFSSWINRIANEQVIEYYKTNIKNHAFDISFLSDATHNGLNKDVQDFFNLEALHNHLRYLTTDEKHTLVSKFFFGWPTTKYVVRMMTELEVDVHTLQMRTLQNMSGYLEDLHLGRELKPSPTFNAYTRSWLIQYMRFHTSRPQNTAPSWRTSLVITGLIAALLVTGTANAQSALPGELFYGWKRTSEQAWRTFSLDPVGTDMVLAKRRLNEWIAVKTDPTRSTTAMQEYFAVISNLKPAGDAQRARIIPELNAQKLILNNAGLSTTQLDNYLVAAANPVVTVTPTQVASSAAFAKTATQVPTSAASSATEVPIFAAPTAVPTVIIPTATQVPTEIIVPTDIPTEVVPTEVPTEEPPTDVPTEVVSPPTDVPTEVVSPPTDVPTEDTNPPAPTDNPHPTPTDELP